MWDPPRPYQTTMKCAGWAIPQLSGQTERDSLGEMKGCRRRKIKITTVVEYGETEKDHQLDDDQLSPLCKGLSHALFSRHLTFKWPACLSSHLPTQKVNPFLNTSTWLSYWAPHSQHT